MNIGYETYIKQEFLDAEDDVKTTLPVSELNILVKNEPISDNLLPFVTIKNEPLNEVTITEASYNIKIEDLVQNQLSTPIYELQTPAIPKQIQHVDNKLKTRQIINETAQLNTITNITQLNPFDADSIQTLAKQSTQIPAKHNEENKITFKSTTTSPPVLLNGKLRKRNKVVLPINPIAKRTRYNIVGVIAPAKNLTTATTDLLNGGDKKIINHLIKNKRNQRKLEHHTIKSSEYLTALESKNFFSKSKEMQNEIPLVKLIEKPYSNLPENRINFSTNEIKTQTEIHVNLKALTALSLTDLNTPQEISNTPELRVKCLCSLAADTSNTTSYTLELRDFFQKMFEKTRRLNKKQQRKIKMRLLQAILDAEDFVEQGKCCSF